jgi:hypothetical protein
VGSGGDLGGSAYDGFMTKRLWGYLTVISGMALAGVLVESPAWAGGLVEARRGIGIFRGLGLVCCLVVVGLVALGVVIGLAFSRRGRGRGPGPGPGPGDGY